MPRLQSNLSKFLLFLLSGNISEVVLLLIGLAFKDATGQSVYPIVRRRSLSSISSFCNPHPSLFLFLFSLL